MLHQLKGSGYKVVHMVPRQSLTTLPKYDEMVNKQNKALGPSDTNTCKTVSDGCGYQYGFAGLSVTLAMARVLVFTPSTI